jgi:hypothetical protein
MGTILPSKLPREFRRAWADETSISPHDPIGLSSTLYIFERLFWLLCSLISEESIVLKHRLVTPDLGKTLC